MSVKIGNKRHSNFRAREKLGEEVVASQMANSLLSNFATGKWPIIIQVRLRDKFVIQESY